MYMYYFAVTPYSVGYILPVSVFYEYCLKLMVAQLPMATKICAGSVK